MSYCLNPHCPKPQNLPTNLFCQTCGTKLLLKQRYRALKIIGKGGFGRTFLAQDEDKPSKPRCVIKQFYPEEQTNIEKAQELFEQEAIRLEKLGKHPQIPNLYAHFIQDDRQYIVQEFIEGETLEQELTEKGVFSEAEIRSILADLLPVLQFIHQGEVIHRDIKPENIIRRFTDNKLVLVDFGAAKYATATLLGKTGTKIGSVEYAAPEQMRGKAVFASDIYSLGVTCLYLLTQISPFDLFDSNEDAWVWRQYLLNNPVSDQLGYILDNMVHNSLKERYHSVDEVMEDLDLKQPKISQADNHEKWFKQGKDLDKSKRYQDAIACYNKAIEIEPNYAEAWHNKGIALYNVKRYEGAIDSFKQATSIEPNFAQAWNNLGLALTELQRYEEAISSFKKALSLKPNYVEAKDNLRKTRELKRLKPNISFEIPPPPDLQPVKDMVEEIKRKFGGFPKL
jgi:serine/threonine protein kinase